MAFRMRMCERVPFEQSLYMVLQPDKHGIAASVLGEPEIVIEDAAKAPWRSSSCACAMEQSPRAIPQIGHR
jgi:hypothetical protein